MIDPTDPAPPPVVRIGELPAAGDVIGKFEILATAGTGGMGELLAARDTELDRRVALKFLRRELGEARAAGRRGARTCPGSRPRSSRPTGARATRRGSSVTRGAS